MCAHESRLPDAAVPSLSSSPQDSRHQADLRRESKDMPPRKGTKGKRLTKATRGWSEPFIDPEDNVFAGDLTPQQLTRFFQLLGQGNPAADESPVAVSQTPTAVEHKVPEAVQASPPTEVHQEADVVPHPPSTESSLGECDTCVRV